MNFNKSDSTHHRWILIDSQDKKEQTFYLLRTAVGGPRWTAAVAGPWEPGWPVACSSGMFRAWVTAFMTMSPRGIRYIHWTYTEEKERREVFRSSILLGSTKLNKTRKNRLRKLFTPLNTHIFSPKGPFHWLYTFTLSLLPTEDLFRKYWSSV